MARKNSAIEARLASGLFIATLLAFLPALWNGFVIWDDDFNFLLNPRYRGLGWGQLKWMFTTFHLGPYQPLSWVSCGLDYLLWGMNPTGYHLTSLLIHAGNAVLLYACFLHLYKLALPEISRTPRALAFCAAFGALAFSVHPLRVESVAWATERRDVLSGFFYLLTILGYLRSRVGAGPGGRLSKGGLWLCYLAALLCKGSVITLPLVLVLLDIYPLRRLSGPSGRWFCPEQRSVWVEKLPFFAMALAFGLVGLYGQRHHAEMRPWLTYGFAERFAQACFGTIFYIYKYFLPFKLLPLYELPGRLDPLDPLFAGSILAVAAISGFVCMARRRWPSLLAFWFYHVATLLPVLGFVQFGTAIAADRYTYLPAMGWAALLGGGLARLKLRRKGLYVTVSFLAVAGLAGLGALTWRQTLIWRDTRSLWGYALSLDPRLAIAYNNIGQALEERGEAAAAEGSYAEAVRIRPAYAQARANLGNSLAARGRLDEAIALYREALASDPRLAGVHNNLGVALAAQGRLEEAIGHYREALSLEPGLAAAHNSWGQALAAQGRLDQAAEHFREALRLRPDLPQAHCNLGDVLATQGRDAEALEQYRSALGFAPGYPPALQALARLQRKGLAAPGP